MPYALARLGKRLFSFVTRAHPLVSAVDAANAVVGQFEKQIARNPVTSVLAALGVGFCLGLLRHRR